MACAGRSKHPTSHRTIGIHRRPSMACMAFPVLEIFLSPVCLLALRPRLLSLILETGFTTPTGPTLPPALDLRGARSLKDSGSAFWAHLQCCAAATPLHIFAGPILFSMTATTVIPEVNSH